MQITNDTVRGKHCLMALLILDKGFNREAFKATMSKVWKLDGWVAFKEVGDSRFIIDFQEQSDKDKVLHGRPWFLDALLALHAFDGGMAIKDIP